MISHEPLIAKWIETRLSLHESVKGAVAFYQPGAKELRDYSIVNIIACTSTGARQRRIRQEAGLFTVDLFLEPEHHMTNTLVSNNPRRDLVSMLARGTIVLDKDGAISSHVDSAKILFAGPAPIIRSNERSASIARIRDLLFGLQGEGDRTNRQVIVGLLCANAMRLSLMFKRDWQLSERRLFGRCKEIVPDLAELVARAMNLSDVYHDQEQCAAEIFSLILQYESATT